MCTRSRPRPSRSNRLSPPSLPRGCVLAKDPAQRPGGAASAWSQLEEIAVEQLGWRWRHAARLAPDAGVPTQKPLTPAKFEPEYQTFSASPAPAVMSTDELHANLEARGLSPAGPVRPKTILTPPPDAP